MVWICEIYSLPPAPTEDRKMHGLHTGRDPDDQPSSLYSFPMGDTLSDIVVDIIDHISSPSCGMWSRKVFKLLPYLGVRSCRYYCVEWPWPEGESLPQAITELGGMRSYDNLNKTNVFSASESEDWKLHQRLCWRRHPGWTGGLTMFEQTSLP